MNQYGVMLVNPDKHPSVKRADGQAFIDWLVSPEGQGAIADYKIGGEQLFFPNAGEPARETISGDALRVDRTRDPMTDDVALPPLFMNAAPLPRRDGGQVGRAY